MDEIKVFAKENHRCDKYCFTSRSRLGLSASHLVISRRCALEAGGRPKNSAEEGDVVVVSSAERYWGRGEGRQKNFWEGGRDRVGWPVRHLHPVWSPGRPSSKLEGLT